MATYLRDEQIFNVTVDAELIEQVVGELSGRAQTMPEYEELNENGEHDLFIVFTIRYDQKGYRIFNAKELLDYFNQAVDVERIIFQIESGKSLRSNNVVGGYLNLRLDKLQPSFLTVSSDNEAWMDGAFSGVKEILVKHKGSSPE